MKLLAALIALSLTFGIGYVSGKLDNVPPKWQNVDLECGPE